MLVYDWRTRSSCWKSTTMWEKLKFHLPLAFISITAGVLLLMFWQFLLDANFSDEVGVILGFIAAVLFLFGVCLILIFWRTKLHNPSQVVISSIPDEDLENFPAPILPSNHACSSPSAGCCKSLFSRLAWLIHCYSKNSMNPLSIQLWTRTRFGQKMFPKLRHRVTKQRLKWQQKWIHILLSSMILPKKRRIHLTSYSFNLIYLSLS